MQTLSLRASVATFAWLLAAAVHGASSAASDAACSPFDTAFSSSMWTVMATNPACAAYATSGAIADSTQFTWPCSATDCTQQVALVVGSMPECFVPGKSVTERANMQASITACKEAPSGNSSGSTTTTKTPSPTTKTPSPTTKTPSPATTTSSPTTTKPSPTTTTKPSPTSKTSLAYSSSSCSTSEVIQVTGLFLTAARSAECKAYAMTGAYIISIFAPCTTSCVTIRYKALVDATPDCVLRTTDAEYVNKKEQLTTALQSCSGAGRETSLYFALTNADPMEAKHDA